MTNEPVQTTPTGEGGPEIPAQDRPALPVGGEGPGDTLPIVRSRYQPGRVLPAYLHQHRVSHSFHQSMIGLVVHDAIHERRLLAPLTVHCSGPNSIPESRNLAVKHFLDGTEAEWLWFVDTDMGFKPDTVDQLVGVAGLDKDRVVVGGLCFAALNVGPDGYGGFMVRPVPTIFTRATDKDGQVGFANLHRYPPNTLMRVDGTGAACLLIHRTVLEDIRWMHGDRWFDMTAYEDGRTVSEDLSFCWRVHTVNRAVHVHTGIRTTHHKDIWVGEDLYTMPASEPVLRRADG